MQKKKRPGARSDEQHRTKGKSTGDTESKPTRPKQDNRGQGQKGAKDRPTKACRRSTDGNRAVEAAPPVGCWRSGFGLDVGPEGGVELVAGVEDQDLFADPEHLRGVSSS